MSQAQQIGDTDIIEFFAGEQAKPLSIYSVEKDQPSTDYILDCFAGDYSCWTGPWVEIDCDGFADG